MTQADFTIANQTFPNTRTELNTSLQALATNSAGNSAPSTTFPSQWHFDSDGNQLYIRNKDNDAWVEVFSIGATTDKIDTIADNIFIGTSGQLGVGIAPALALHVSSGADNVTARFESTDTEVAIELKDTTGTAIIASRNDFRFTTGGSETMRLDTSGNLGIGTSAPVVPLSVKASQEQLTLSEGDARGATFDYRSSTGNLNITTNGGNARTAPQFTLDLNGNVGIGTASPALASGNGIVVHGGSSIARVELRNDTSGSAATDGMFLTYSGTDAFVGNREAGTIQFWNNAAERMRILSDGALNIGKTSGGLANAGVEIATDKLSATVSAANVQYINRLSNDGALVTFYQATSEEGSISVSGNTVSYNGFTGSHWSRLADNSKPTILRGTIMESIDEMCDWYQAVADVAEVKYTAEDSEVIDGDKNVGDVKTEAYTVKESIILNGKSVGDSITFTSNTTTGDGKEHTGTIVKEDDVKHTKSKVSDTADSKKVYGVFSNWDDADDGLDGDVNDMNIAQVGTYIIRVNKDEVVQGGDLLVSNGDGTAKKQDDDIIRSKTVAKVNSTVKIETYADGSYTVPCTLHC